MNTPPRQAPSPKYIALLAGLSLLILVIGFRLKPDKPASESAADIPQAELSRLHRLAQRASLDSMTDYFSTVARDVEAHLVRLEPGGPSGVVWGSDRVVTARASGRFPGSVRLVTVAADVVTAVTTVSGPHLPLATVQVSGTKGLRAVRLTSRPVPQAGQWLLAVWRDAQDAALAPGHFQRARGVRCGQWTGTELVTSIPLAPEAAGGGVFDLDGRLLGLVLPCGDRYAVVAAASIEATMDDGRSNESRLLARYGLRLAPANGRDRAHFEGPGLLVSEVWRGYPADTAGLAPGDLISAVDGEAVELSAHAARLLVPPGAVAFELDVKRGRREFKVFLADHREEGPPVETVVPAGGLVWEAPLVGHPIAAVQPDSAAAAAGIRPGDRLLTIDHLVPRSPAQMRRSLTRLGDKPTFVELERDGRRWGVLLATPGP